jgi:hypothetical protein
MSVGAIPHGWRPRPGRAEETATGIWARFIVEPVEVIDFVMTQKMLRGIRSRAEQGG